MLKVQVSKNISKYVEIIPDNGINKGGFYCEIYGDNTHDFKEGDFAIDKKDISINQNMSPSEKATERLKRAKIIAESKTRDRYAHYRH